MLKWIIGIVVIALAAAALWWSGWLGKMTPTPAATTTPQTTEQQTPQAQAPTNGMSANNDASDAAITQDTAAIDAQMTGLTQDSGSIDSSLSDKSVQ